MKSVSFLLFVFIFEILTRETLQAGRLPEFDGLAAKFFEATSSARQTILKDASALAQTVGPAAKHYIRVMEKVVNGSEEYLQKEVKR